METANYISVTKFCTHHELDYAFIRSLDKYGLVQIFTIEEDQFIEKGQLRELEKMMRLHYELHINLEGIDAIYHLLHKVSSLQDEIAHLRNRLKLYEE